MQMEDVLFFYRSWWTRGYWERVTVFCFESCSIKVLKIAFVSVVLGWLSWLLFFASLQIKMFLLCCGVNQVSNKTKKISTVRIFTSYIFLYVIQITFVITITFNLLHFFVLIPELSFKTAHNLKPQKSIHWYMTRNFPCGNRHQ
jgi:hypothetical protein